MKTFNKQITSVVFAVSALCAVSLYGIDSSAGTGASAFMKIGAGCPRAQALGRAYSSIASGADAVFWNPAGIASTTKREFLLAHLAWVQDYSGQTASYIQPLWGVVVGAHFSYLKMEDFDARDDIGIPISNRDVQVMHSFGGVTVAKSFVKDTVNLGVSAKRVYEDNDGDTYSNFVFDFGGQFKLGRALSAGAVWMNFGDDKEVVQIRRYGAALGVGPYVTLTGEIEDASDNKARLGVGVEVTLGEDLLQVGKLSLRFGYYDADDKGTNYEDGFLKTLGLNRTSKISLGAGIFSSEVMGYGFALDYAMMPSGALGTAHQIAAKVTF